MKTLQVSFVAAAMVSLLVAAETGAGELPLVGGVEIQPLSAQARRVAQALDYLGEPLSGQDAEALERATEAGDALKIQEVLDAYCLFGVSINPEMRVKVAPGPAKPELVEQGWRQFLVKVHNEAGTTARLQVESPNAQSVFESRAVRTSSDPPRNRPKQDFSAAAQRARWLEIEMHDGQPLRPRLSGLEIEYRIVQLYSRDAGRREAQVAFNVGQGTQDLGFRNETDLLFRCLPATELTLRVLDEGGKPTTAAFTIRDRQGRVYPSQAKRLAPDFAFHPQVYRADGESIRLPEGAYTVEFVRGPESVPEVRGIEVGGERQTQEFKVKRWIDPSESGWWSGDHHIHAAGCKHYTNPSEGVHAPDMMRHCLGEDLKVGANLTWGPCFDYQKQFFTGEVDAVSQYPYLLRYDIEVSGFGSHRSGHLCLLRLKEQMYPGGDSSDHWPTLCLNTLRWAKRQGALAGPAHSGWGLAVPTDQLPNYVVPPFDGIGANEYIVDVTHKVPGPEGKPVPAVDFVSTVDTPYVWELNIWYHTLNCGFRTRISGETDFPCIYGERVGLGRSYVKLDGKLDYNEWCEGIRKGRNYVSDGRSHILGFQVEDTKMGEQGSQVDLAEARTVKVQARVAARLPEEADAALGDLPYSQKPFWHVERARIEGTRKVPVEVIVNGYPVARREIVADGTLRDVAFDVPISQSSWVAMRILATSHTNPVFVLVDGRPIRASRRSAEWCLKGVEACWKQKERFIAAGEMEDAREAYAHARRVYRRIVSESAVE